MKTQYERVIGVDIASNKIDAAMIRKVQGVDDGRETQSRLLPVPVSLVNNNGIIMVPSTIENFTGLTIEETAKVPGVSPRTTKRNWAYARAWLKRAIDGDGWTDKMLNGSVGILPFPWFDWIEVKLLHSEASVLLTGFTPADDPRIRQIEARAMAAIRE